LKGFFDFQLFGASWISFDSQDTEIIFLNI